MPERIQLRRSAGWRLPAGAVKVDRTTKWGNPFVIGKPHPLTGRPITRDEAFVLYRAAMCEAGSPLARHLKPGCSVDAARAELAGHDLACWCASGALCHADLLIEIAN